VLRDDLLIITFADTEYVPYLTLNDLFELDGWINDRDAELEAQKQAQDIAAAEGNVIDPETGEPARVYFEKRETSYPPEIFVWHVFHNLVVACRILRDKVLMGQEYVHIGMYTPSLIDHVSADVS
jgi:hypothetical protein